MLNAFIRGEIGHRLGIRELKDKYNARAGKATQADLDVVSSAILNNDIALVRRYLDKFGDSIVNKQFEDDAHIHSMFGYRRGYGDTLLMKAAEYNRPEIALMLIEKYGALVNKENNFGETALLRAVWKAGTAGSRFMYHDDHDHDGVISVLVAHGANPHKRDKRHGYSPMIVAKKYHEHIIPLLNGEASQKQSNTPPKKIFPAPGDDNYGMPVG